MDGVAKEALLNINAFLRIVASGWMTLLALVLVDGADALGLHAILQGPNAWIAPAGAALAGIAAHAVYMSVLDDVFLGLVLRIIRHQYPREFPTSIDSEAGWVDRLQRELYRERAARNASNGALREVQAKLTVSYAWLVFMYCTFLLLLGSTLWAHHYGICTWSMLGWPVVALVLAFCSDVNLTRHELWLIKHHKEWPSVGSASSAPLRLVPGGTSAGAPSDTAQLLNDG